MTIHKIKAGRVTTVEANTFVGQLGTMWYDENTGELRIYNGNPGGNIVSAGGGSYTLPTASVEQLGGVKIDGNTIVISNTGVITANISPGAILPNNSVGYLKNDGSGTLTWDNNVNTSTDRITNGTANVVINANASVSFPYYRFPLNDGNDSQVLTTTGTGTLYWSTITGGAGAANLLIDGGSSATEYTESTLILDGGGA